MCLTFYSIARARVKDEKEPDDNVNINCNNPNPSIPESITIYSALVARINLFHARGFYFEHLHSFMSRFVDYCNQSECQELMIMLSSSQLLYFDVIDHPDPASYKIAGKEWLTSCVQLIKGCGPDFLVTNAKLWFPILYQIPIDHSSYIENEGYDEIIFNEIIPKLNTQLAFDFGLYLVDFIVYKQRKDENKNENDSDNQKSNFDKRYFEFVKNSVGITWELL